MAGGELVGRRPSREGLPHDDLGLVQGVRIRGGRRQVDRAHRRHGGLRGGRQDPARLGPHGGPGLLNLL